MNKLAVVGIFDRGHYIAHRMSEMGMDVTYVDLSHLFSWPESYWRGPFPLFKTNRFEGDLWNWLEKNFTLRKLENGCTVLTENGPLELSGSLAEYRIEKMGQNKNSLPPKRWLSVLGMSGLSAIEQLPALQRLSPQLSKKLSSSTEVKSASNQGLDVLRSPAYILGKFKGKPGYNIIKDFHIEDIALEGRRKMKGLLLKKDRSEVFDVHQMVWTLSSSETLHLNENLVKVLYGAYYRESIYTWVRAEIELTDSGYLPDHVILLVDPELPWAYENFFTLERKAGDSFSIWFKIASSHRFSREFTMECLETLLKQLKKMLPESQSLIKNLPLEVQQTSKSLGPAIFQSFREGTLTREIELSSATIHFLSHETSVGNAGHSLLESELDLSSKLEAWWKAELTMQLNKEKRSNDHGAEQ